ncbi:MAG: DUF1839 family protein [Solirubrobacteraceae bacterium]
MSATGVGLDPATYVPHPVHRDQRSYPETNCYTDIVVELLHARGYEPLAALGFLVRMDFEGDQWTFFKPPPGDLEALFGVDIHEMQPYRALPDQIAEQLGAGRTVIVELDSWFLPDTAATDYRRAHVKTSVVAEAIDREAETLRYFHNAGLHELRGEDYRGAFAAAGLPPYTEIARFDARPRLDGGALRAEALRLLRDHLARRPATNPFDRFGERLAADLPGLLDGDAAGYHAYAFATVRMAGAAFELLGSHARWLLGDAGEPAAAACERIVEGCKVLSFRLARRRAFDPQPALAGLAAAWEDAMAALDAAVA